MRFYDPFDAAPAKRKPVVPTAPRSAARSVAGGGVRSVAGGKAGRAAKLVRDETTGELSLPSFDKASAFADIAKKVPSGRRERLAKEAAETLDIAIKPLDAECWDFGLDPMDWACVRYERWETTDSLFEKATPYEAPFKKTGALFSQLFGAPTRAA